MGQPSSRPQLALADSIWCFTAGKQVPVETCATSCGAPELRPRCWAARGIARSFDDPDTEPVAYTNVTGEDYVMRDTEVDGYEPPTCPACGHRQHVNDVCERDMGEFGECQCAWSPELGGSE